MTKIPPPPPPLAKHLQPSAHDPETYNPRSLELDIEDGEEYDVEFANRILDRLEEGFSLDGIQSQCNGVSPRIVYNWAKQCATFNNALVDSLEIRAEVLIDQTVVIADGSDPPMVKKQRIETRERLAAFDNKRFVKRNATEVMGLGNVGLMIDGNTKKSQMSREQFIEIMEDDYLTPIMSPAGSIGEKPRLSLTTNNLGDLDAESLMDELMGVGSKKVTAAINLWDEKSRSKPVATS